MTVRPLDAYGALRYLQSRADVAPERMALQGWSNGGGATIAAMAKARKFESQPGFVAAIALYPNCGLRGQFRGGYRPYAVALYTASADEEVSSARCEALVSMSQGQGGDVGIVIYSGATHGLDDPSRRRRSNPANDAASGDAFARIWAFLAPLVQ